MRFSGRAPKSELGGAQRRFTLPTPTPQFRRRAWREFQRALDPLGPSRPFMPRRQP